MVDSVRRTISRVAADGKTPVMLGGEHSISFGAVQAMKEIYPEITVLQLDAHADLRDAYQGTPYSHASVARRITGICPLIQAGIRSLSVEEAEFMEEGRVRAIRPISSSTAGHGGRRSAATCTGISTSRSTSTFSIRP